MPSPGCQPPITNSCRSLAFTLRHAGERFPGCVRTVEALRHDPLEALLLGRLEQRRALAFEMVPRHRPPVAGGDEVHQQAPALDVRQRHHVVTVEMQQVEHDIRDRHVLRAATYLGGTSDVHAVLQSTEARPAALVERDHLTVEYDGVPVEGSADRGQLGIALRRVDAVAAQQRDPAGAQDASTAACRPT